jgi:crossover junction endodeoxyribonuclease RuvC
MNYLGVDPGKGGAAALLKPGGDPIFWNVPTVKVGGRNEYDVAGMARIVAKVLAEGPARAAVEHQQAFPGQGVASSFSTGVGFGIWLGLLASARIPYVTVRPATWKRRMGVPAVKGDKQKKGAAIATALARFPGVDFRRTERCRGPDHNRAEAALLAAWARNEAW